MSYVLRRLLSLNLPVLMLLGLYLAGCTHLGDRLARDTARQESVTIQEILADLAHNDSFLENFRAGARFRVEARDIGRHNYKGYIAFRSPEELYLQGAKMGVKVLEMTCVGEDWLMWLPRSKELYYKVGTKQSNAFRFSMSELIREMVFQERWSELPLENVSMLAHDGETQTATLEIWSGGVARRRIEVAGLPWVVVRSEVLDDDGAIRGIVTRSEYHELDGVRFPAHVAAEFPKEEAHMTFKMTNIRINTEQVKDEMFDLESRMKRRGIE